MFASLSILPYSSPPASASAVSVHPCPARSCCAAFVGSAAKAALSVSPRLDESGPSVDLLANRALWHVFRRGLTIPFGSEGFRKYSQEYTSPWRGVGKLQDRAVAFWVPRRATCTSLGRRNGAATIVVRMSGDSGQRLSLRLNGKSLKTAALASGWQAVPINVSAGVLRLGENDLVIAVARKGALFHSLEVIGGPAPEPADAWPASSPVIAVSVAGQERAALAGSRRYAMLLEVPRQSFLVLETAASQAAAHLRVSARPEGQPIQILLDETQPPGRWQPRTLSLAALAGKLVSLEFAVLDGGEALWATPRILLAAAPSLRAPNRCAIWFCLSAMPARRQPGALQPDQGPHPAHHRSRSQERRGLSQHRGCLPFITALACQHPERHPARVNGILGDKAKLNPGTPMISAVLGADQIATGYYGTIHSPWGASRPRPSGPRITSPRRRVRAAAALPHQNDAGLADEQVKAGRRFFLSSIAFEPHTPYIYHQGITEHYVKASLTQPSARARRRHPHRHRERETLDDPGALAATARALRRRGRIPRWVLRTLVDGLATRGLRDDTASFCLQTTARDFSSTAV